MSKRDLQRLDAITQLQAVFDSEEGKKVLYELMKSCHMLHSTFDPNPQEMAYREGERSVVLRILNTLNVDPIQLLKRIEEGNQQEDKYVD
jgi:hypothetical protein